VESKYGIKFLVEVNTTFSGAFHHHLIQIWIQELDGAKKCLKIKVLRIRQDQCHCVHLVLPILAIYPLSQTDTVCESYRTLIIFPNREKVNRSSQMLTSAVLTWQWKIDMWQQRQQGDWVVTGIHPS
jgi:hypothetical protein